MSLGAVVVWVSRRSCQLVDLEETKTVFPVQMLEYKGNHSALSGWTGSKIKDHDLVRLNNPNFLMHLFVFVLCIFFLWQVAGQDMLWPTFPCLLVVNLLLFPLDGSQACCLLLKLTQRQQVAPVRRNIWAVTLGSHCLSDILHSPIVKHIWKLLKSRKVRKNWFWCLPCRAGRDGWINQQEYYPTCAMIINAVMCYMLWCV